MDFQERKDENLEQRKETAARRKLFLENYERNRRPPKKPHVWTMANALGPPLNTPTKITFVVGSKESIESGACGSHVSPTIKPESSANPSMVTKDEQTYTEEIVTVVPMESRDTPDFSVGGNRKTPIEVSKSIMSNHMGEHTNPNDLNISSSPYLHPEMVFVTASTCTLQTVVTKFKILEGKVVEVLDNVGQDLWGEAVGLYSSLSVSAMIEWLVRAMCCLEEETNTTFLYGDETHCLIEFRDLGARYSFQFYRGIYTWYVKFLNIDYHPNPMHQWSDFPQKLFPPPKKMTHPFYRNRLVPQTHLDFVNCEAFAKRHWKLQHKDCQQGHFRVNIYVNSKQPESPYVISTTGGEHTVGGENLQSPLAKFASYRVCGHALVVDLFHAMGGSVSGREAGKPQDWQCLREVMWHKQVQPTKTPTLELGRSYVYGALRNEIVKTRLVDTDWFRCERNYVWLLPAKQDPGGSEVFDLKPGPK